MRVTCVGRIWLTPTFGDLVLFCTGFSGGQCGACGTDGDPCCADGSCREGVCVGGFGGGASCEVSCGADGQPCCDNG